ncbi:MAG: hypothetical protein LC734_00355 [Acidobacteria bacterium]|nr:hypothetical protein [Acidobacteriota bacterium]
MKDGRGVVFASEMVLSIGTPGSVPEIGQMYVCPDDSTLESAVRHGIEHIVIANNDPGYFTLTYHHANGLFHPLLPKRVDSRPVDQTADYGSRSSQPIEALY